VVSVPGDVRDRFDVDWDGPARLIYEFVVDMRTEPSTKIAAVKALRGLFGTLPPPGAPQIVIPDEIVRDVRQEELYTPGLDGAPDVRSLVYHPPATGTPPPVVVYAHGGGGSMEKPEEGEFFCRKLALRAGVVVMTVDWRWAPEHPYPAGLDDFQAVYGWVRQHAAERLDADPSRVAVGGDSSGGNFAAALPLRVRDAGQRVPDATVLLCPLTDFWFEKYDSARRNGTRGLIYDTAFLGFVRSAYAPYDWWTNPYVSPMLGDLRSFGPTLIVSAGQDLLVDENAFFAQKLQEAGNADVQRIVYEAMPHSFYYFLGLCQEEDQCFKAMAAFLRRTLRIGAAA
jgi:acetyl esterase